MQTTCALTSFYPKGTQKATDIHGFLMFMLALRWPVCCLDELAAALAGYRFENRLDIVFVPLSLRVLHIMGRCASYIWSMFCFSALYMSMGSITKFVSKLAGARVTFICTQARAAPSAGEAYTFYILSKTARKLTDIKELG